MKKTINALLKPVVLVSLLLTAHTASAVLLDHGPSDPTLLWPQWYRDDNGLAVGLCKSQVQSPNAAAGVGKMCFPAVTDPAGFPGNVGPELFYGAVEFREKATGSDFRYRYLAGLESSYLPLGVPVHGTETVFARVRIALNFNDPAKNGTYTVTHPYGVQVFPNLTATNNANLFGVHAAVFFTVDVPLAAINDFNSALAGAIGPFPQWDVLQAGESLTVGTQTFLGDPNIPHTFTGSPFGTNFIRIDGPVGSNLDGLGNDFIQTDVANVLGQIWQQPIAQPVAIDSTYLTRDLAKATNAVDIWATSTPNQRLVLSGPNIPSLQLFPSGGAPTTYHGHIEYPAGQPVPSTVNVTNLSSTPVVTTTSAVVDGVEITQATFDTTTRQLSVIAHSSDEISGVNLAITGIPGVPSATGVVPVVSNRLLSTTCPVGTTQPRDVCFIHTLPANIEPPAKVSITSTGLGSNIDHLVSIVGTPENPANPPIATNFLGTGFSVNTSGTTTLTSANGTLPTDAIIVQQPANGVVTRVGASWAFTANATTATGNDNFQYLRQAANNAPVSNIATANLTLLFNPSAPIANSDQFAAATRTTKTVLILANDVPGSTNPVDVINPATTSLTIVNGPKLGTLVKNATGSISYTATSGGADSFTYTVNNSSVPAKTSNVATVLITNFTAAEVVSITKPLYTIASSKWTIVGATTWFGPNLTQASATCWTGIGATPTASTLIGSAPIDITGKFQLAPVGGPVGVNNSQITCQSSHGGKAAATLTAK